MKKKYENGEQVQGTPEEIAEYDRLRRGKTDEAVTPGKKKPEVLKGSEPMSDEDVAKMLDTWVKSADFRKAVDEIVERTTRDWPKFNPIWIGPYIEYPCWHCGAVGCRQNHIWYGTVGGTSIDFGTDFGSETITEGDLVVGDTVRISS